MFPPGSAGILPDVDERGSELRTERNCGSVRSGTKRSRNGRRQPFNVAAVHSRRILNLNYHNFKLVVLGRLSYNRAHGLRIMLGCSRMHPSSRYNRVHVAKLPATPGALPEGAQGQALPTSDRLGTRGTPARTRRSPRPGLRGRHRERDSRHQHSRRTR